MSDDVVYYGNFFNVALVGGEWAIWRISDDDGNREQIILTDEAMEELRNYFADFYAEDRGDETAAMREP